MDKLNLIHNLQHILKKRWGTDVADKNYNISRLKTMDIYDLLDLERETKKDLLLISKLNYNAKENK
jgi:hypothetical protein|tara:strand:- start:264 stop:461 length:198 start_codon:yes stop_codon:yes gene_type:complete